MPGISAFVSKPLAARDRKREVDNHILRAGPGLCGCGHEVGPVTRPAVELQVLELLMQ